MTTPGGPGFDWYIAELGIIANGLVDAYPADKRWTPLVATVGRISAEWHSGSSQAAQDITTLLGQAEAMKANYPTDSSVDIVLRYAQAMANVWESDILNEE